MSRTWRTRISRMNRRRRLRWMTMNSGRGWKRRSHVNGLPGVLRGSEPRGRGAGSASLVAGTAFESDRCRRFRPTPRRRKMKKS
jgi:hypothetical protein